MSSLVDTVELRRNWPAANVRWRLHFHPTFPETPHYRHVQNAVSLFGGVCQGKKGRYEMSGEEKAERPKETSASKTGHQAKNV